MASLSHLIAAQGTSGVIPERKTPKQPEFPPTANDGIKGAQSYELRVAIENKIEHVQVGTYDKFAEVIIITLQPDALDGDHSILMGRWYKIGSIGGSPVFRQD